ncbi:MAG: DNA methyltransferase [Candidatus Dadabacteria bacterium]|nr:DNA methyltransferase [Candidatus Dadabacteria bacterium]
MPEISYTMPIMPVNPHTLFTGDNLPIMRGMDSESVDLIYLDPPFNKKKDFIAPIGSKAEGAEFKDWWTMDDVKDEEIGEIGEAYPPISDLINTAGDISGESHRSYLIVMAIRLIEMKRLLKPTGSIYLHCDPTMSHWLKLLMDAVFGDKNFRNEIVWHYRRWTGGAKKFQQLHDVILFYSRQNNYLFNVLYTPYTEKSLKRKQNYHTRIKGDDVYVTSTDKRGVRENDVWQIPVLNSQSKERTGYPTQKPLALLERIIKASSNKDNIVLDPFCGCATTLIAAQTLERKWIGIDQSVKAVELVRQRMAQQDLFVEVHHWDTNEKGFPKRRDGITISPDIKRILYGRQMGHCEICGFHFRYQNLEIDHIIPKSKGGGEGDDNKQLLCGHCNRTKGNRLTNAETKARLKEQVAEYQEDVKKHK